MACENGTRPAGVLTYPPEDAGELARLVTETLANRASVVAGLARFPLPDTLPAEVQILTS